MPITQDINPICYKAQPLPHELTGNLVIGTIAPNTGAVVSIASTSVPGSYRYYDIISDGAGLLTINIPDSHRCFYSAFEACCYKVTVIHDGCPIPFTIDAVDYDCVLLCLQIDCDTQAPYELKLCGVNETTDTNCNTCQ